jgi:hypothetical protein
MCIYMYTCIQFQFYLVLVCYVEVLSEWRSGKIDVRN